MLPNSYNLSPNRVERLPGISGQHTSPNPLLRLPDMITQRWAGDNACGMYRNTKPEGVNARTFVNGCV